MHETATPRDPLESYSVDPFRSFDEGIEELGRHFPLTPEDRSVLDRALSTVNAAAWSAFLDRHRNRLKTAMAAETLRFTGSELKYADLPLWASQHVVMARALGLDRRPPLRLLDIGGGSGSFAMVAQSMGHDAETTDVPNPWYEELCALLGVPRTIAPIAEGEAYAPGLGRFDLITLMLPVFHRRSVRGQGRVHWPLTSWQRLLRSLVEDSLAERGRIHLLMPQDRQDDDSLAPSELVGWAGSIGAEVKPAGTGSILHSITFSDSRPLLAL